MRPLFNVTYDTITPESAAIGDVDESGFMQPGEWKTPLDGRHGAAAAALKAESAMPLRAAAGLVGCVEDGGHGFYEVDGRQNYRTGAVERRAIHPPDNITAASYRRLARLLCAL